jgi:Trk K+ transport system NAD-binding subunit
LIRVNLITAKSVIALTPDEVNNLEICLIVGKSNPDSRLLIRTDDPHFSENVIRLIPHAQALGVYRLAAEAFAAAAFGENIQDLLRVNHQTVLVTEYRLNVGDLLNGQLLTDVANGYGVVPILHKEVSAKLMIFFLWMIFLYLQEIA